MPSQLPQDTIDKIREMRARNIPAQLIAQALAVHPSTVRLYVSGKKALEDEIVGMPAWPLMGWELRARKIRE